MLQLINLLQMIGFGNCFQGLRLAILVAGSILFCINANAQQQELDSLQQTFDNYQQHALQEKLYVHTDRNFYLAGETVWFKLYSLDGTAHKPLNLNRVAYFEVLDRANKPVLQSKVAMVDAKGQGAIVLPATLPTGRYKIKTYTNWMKNFSELFFYKKDITIVNTISELQPAKQDAKQVAYDARFFPEGGNLVQGISNRVAFRVTDQQGKGVKFHGAILTPENDTIVKFAPLKFGIGSFVFQPQDGVKYKAVITPVGGKTFTKDLPKIYQQGYAMQVTEDGSQQLKVTVSANNQNSSQLVYLFAHTRQVSRLAASGNISNGKVIFKVDKALLGDGISHLTIFDANKTPVCERLVFKRPSKKLAIQAKTEKAIYTFRQQVKLSIATNNSHGKATAANMSLALFPADSLQTIDQADIYTYLWLTSDLAGAIESPSFYFTDTKEADLAIDNLMLTHGWRRFKWEDVLQNKNAELKYAPEFEGMIVSAKVTDKVSGQPAAGVPVYLSVPGNASHFATATSNHSGDLRFILKEIYHANELVLQVSPQFRNTYDITLVNKFVEPKAATQFADVNLPRSWYNTLQLNSIHAQVQAHFKTESKSINTSTEEEKMSPFYGSIANTYNLSDYTRFPKMEDIFREYVAEVMVRKRDNKYGIFVLDKTTKVAYAEEPLVLLDGVPVTDMNQIATLNADLVKQVEVINDKYLYGPSVFSGIVSINTTKGDLAGFELNPDVTFFDYEGLQAAREFYAPVYDSPVSLNNRIPDFRNLLYWNPNVITEAGGITDLSFYTSDKKGKYIGVIQGVTDNGEAGIYTFTIEVDANL